MPGQEVRRHCRPAGGHHVVSRKGGPPGAGRGRKALDCGPRPGHQPNYKPHPKSRAEGRGQRKGLGFWSLLRSVHFLGQQSRRGPGNEAERPRDQRRERLPACPQGRGRHGRMPGLGTKGGSRSSRIQTGTQGREGVRTACATWASAAEPTVPCWRWE